MGVAISTLRRSAASVGGFGVGIYAQDLADLLRFMPKGTRVISMEQLPITDLSVGYELKLDHPLFVDGLKIDLNYYRQAWSEKDWDEKERLVQQSVLTGIRYTKPDGTEWMPRI